MNQCNMQFGSFGEFRLQKSWGTHPTGTPKGYKLNKPSPLCSRGLTGGSFRTNYMPLYNE